MFKNSPNIENNENKAGLKSIPPASFAHPVLSPLTNKYEEEPLKSNSRNLSFKGSSFKSISEAVNRCKREIGDTAAKDLEDVITRLVDIKNSGVTRQGDELTFEKESIGKRIFRSIIDPIIYMPLDLANSTLNLLKKIPAFKDSKFIENRLTKGILHNRKVALEDYSNTAALQHYFEMMGKFKDGDIFRESQKRLSLDISNYPSQVERTLTRLTSGLLPALYLANDKHNLSMYINDNKELAEKEKKSRFNQEVVRVGITAASTFAILGLFAKSSNKSFASATFLVTALTFGSEIIGRMVTGVPFYPIGQKGAKKYAELKKKKYKSDIGKGDSKGVNSESVKKDETNTAQIQVSNSNSDSKKSKSKSDYALKILGAMVLIGAGAELLPKYVRPVEKIVSRIKNRFSEFLSNEFTISQREFEDMMKELRKSGFDGHAENYEKMVQRIKAEGNLTLKENNRVNKEIDKLVESELSKKILITPKIKKEEEKIRERINKNITERQAILQRLNLDNKDSNIIYIGGFTDKTKDIIFRQILGFPAKLVWEVITMPYKSVIKPLYELSKQGIQSIRKFIKLASNNFKKGNGPDENEEIKSNKRKTLRNIIQFLRKNSENNDLKDKLSKRSFEAFDNVNKSSFSNADFSGSAKIAVSTATSGFLILDDYSTVMVDSEGKDKELAVQKAKKRALQRTVRIAYGACIVNLFNSIFRSQYNASLLAAQTVTAANTLLNETLERISVGLPLHEATREEIIEKDNANLNAKGLKGFYFKLMSTLTGKKPISEKTDKD